MTDKVKTKKPTKAIRDAYALIGSVGGKATVKKYGKDHMKEIGKKGAEKRWGKK